MKAAIIFLLFLLWTATACTANREPECSVCNAVTIDPPPGDSGSGKFSVR